MIKLLSRKIAVRLLIGMLFITMTASVVFVNAQEEPQQPAAALPRIGAKAASPAGQFYVKSTGAKFTPEGNNYVKLRFVNNKIYNVTFNIGFYNALNAANALSQMHYDEYNVVRILIDGGTANDPHQANGKYGIAGPYTTNTATLYQPYMNNIIDFLRRARDNKIYVIPVLSYLPYNLYYQTMLNSNIPANVESDHVYYMSQNAITAKRIYLREFIQAIKTADPSLLSTIFAYEIQNEVLALSSIKPFSMTSGTVATADGVTYNMADAGSRQQCQDANQVNWANQVGTEIHAIDPGAMVSASVFTFRAVGKAGPNGLYPISASENVFPARPIVLRLYANQLAYTDIHLYPAPDANTYSIDNDLNSSEYPAFNKTSKPILMGEFGANVDAYHNNITSAAYGVKAHRQNAYDRGFAGSLFWVWDHPSSYWWPWYSASESGGTINGQLAPITRP